MVFPIPSSAVSRIWIARLSTQMSCPAAPRLSRNMRQMTTPMFSRLLRVAARHVSNRLVKLVSSHHCLLLGGGECSDRGRSLAVMKLTLCSQ